KCRSAPVPAASCLLLCKFKHVPVPEVPAGNHRRLTAFPCRTPCQDEGRLLIAKSNGETDGMVSPCPPQEIADNAGLRYMRDDSPGLTRRKCGKGFTYINPDGSTCRDKNTIRRAKSLAIPPAWTDVWICPHANGHIQATGRDAKSRKQYIYHPAFRAAR